MWRRVRSRWVAANERKPTRNAHVAKEPDLSCELALLRVHSRLRTAFYRPVTTQLPTAIGCSVGAGLFRSAVDVSNAGLGLVHRDLDVFLDDLPAVGGAGKRIDRDGVEIARTDQVAQTLWGFEFVLSVLIDGLAHAVQILL